jgi:hypothetical protein
MRSYYYVAGDYAVSLVLGGVAVTLRVHVYNFALPKKLTMKTLIDAGTW